MGEGEARGEGEVWRVGEARGEVRGEGEALRGIYGTGVADGDLDTIIFASPSSA